MRSVTTRNQVALVVILIGAILRTVQYGATASMGSDEVALALNVTDRGWRELLSQPLMYDQVAPLGFLFLEKVSVAIVGDNEVAFRFFPYLLSLVSLILFWRVSTRYLRDSSMLAALIVFAMSPTLVLYAGTAKQYSGDIAVTLFLLLMGLRYLERPISLANAAVVGVAGGVALLLSQPGVLVVSGLGALLLVEGWRVGKPYRQLAAICVGWFVGAAIVTFTSLTNLSVSTGAFMEGYWEHDFVPRPWVGLAELFWIPSRLVESISYLVAYLNFPGPLPEIALGVYGLLLLLGILHLVERDLRTAGLLAVPVFVAIIAAAVRLLPLSERVSLFIGPSLLIGCFAGFDRIRTWLPPRRGYLVYAAALAFATLPALTLLIQGPPPWILSGIRPVLQEVKARSLPEDRLVVFRSSMWTRISTKYYGRRLGLEDWTYIDRSRGDHTAEQVLRGYLRSIDAFRGVPRTWFYLDQNAICEDEAILGYLTAIGQRLYSVDFPIDKVSKVSAHLYDLSDAELLGHADAETYQVPECEE